MKKKYKIQKRKSIEEKKRQTSILIIYGDGKRVLSAIDLVDCCKYICKKKTYHFSFLPLSTFHIFLFILLKKLKLKKIFFFFWRIHLAICELLVIKYLPRKVPGN